VLVRDGEELLDLLRGGQGVFNVVPLAGVVGEVDAAIVEFAGEAAPQASTSPHSDVPAPAARPAHPA
jgi:hypothetical protein